MRYLLLDRVLRLRKDDSITAIKSVTLAEDVYADHFFGYPVMPGALLIEAFAQAGTALAEVSSGHQRKALLLMVENAKFRAHVRPGDRLTIKMQVIAQDNASMRLDGTITCEERLVASARIVLGFGDPDLYYPRASRHLIESIYTIWLDGALLEGFEDAGETANPVSTATEGGSDG